MELGISLRKLTKSRFYIIYTSIYLPRADTLNESVPPDSAPSNDVKSVTPDEQDRESAPPIVSDSSEYQKYIKNYWKNLKETENSIFNNARRTFDFSYYLGWIVAGLGIAILVISLIDMRGVEGIKWENTLAGLIGIGTILTQFIYGPQNRVHRSLGDYVQIQIIKNTYTLISQAWNNWDNLAIENARSLKKKIPYSLQELDKLIQILIDSSRKLILDIEYIIGEIEKAYLKVTSLTIDPKEDISIGDEVKVTFEVTNLGTKEGTETFTLYLDGTETENKKEFTLGSGKMQSHEFKIKPEEAKEYEVKVGELKKKFTVDKKSTYITVSDLKVDEIAGEPLKRKLTATFSNTKDTEINVDFDIFLMDELYKEKWNVRLPAKVSETKTKEIDVKTGDNQKVKVGKAESDPFSVQSSE